MDQDGKMLVWTGNLQVPEPDAEGRFHAILPAVSAFLQREKRVPYRTLKYAFGIDEALLKEIQEDLSFRRLARDEDGKGLVWTGEAQPAVAASSLPAATASAVVSPTA